VKEEYKMGCNDALKLITIGMPGIYRIVVKGRIANSWADYLAGMSITVEEGDENETVTALEGKVNDQAELVGVLNSLYDLHLPIVTVELKGVS
jgi:hypothetical protein